MTEEGEGPNMPLMNPEQRLEYERQHKEWKIKREEERILEAERKREEDKIIEAQRRREEEAKDKMITKDYMIMNKKMIMIRKLLLASQY